MPKAPAPTINGLPQTSGSKGDSVLIYGTGFSFGVKSVKFKGVEAKFAVDSDIQLTAVVPAKAKSGPITVSTKGGTASSKPTDFLVS